jgi:hypothetical protein
LDSIGDHNNRVRDAEAYARYADMERGDFIAFKHALGSLERFFQDLWSLLNLDPDIRESLGVPLTEQKRRCEVTRHLIDNVVSRNDRSLNLVSYLHPHLNGWYIKKMLQLLNYTNIQMVEQNAKMTAEMKELAKRNAGQTAQSARQAQSMAVLAYDTKRDSEVMKAITVVTLIFLPATFVSVCPIPHLELTIYPFTPSRHSSAGASSILIRARSRSPTKAGFISLALFRSALSSSEHHLRGYGGVGGRKRSPSIIQLVKCLRKPPICSGLEPVLERRVPDKHN